MTKRIWRHKWWVLAVAMTIFLSVGAVAWAAAGDETAGSTVTPAAEDEVLPSLCAAAGGTTGVAAAGVRERIQNVRERGERWLKRQQVLMGKLREQMNATDQALFDELVATAKEQREALKEARQKLAETMKQLRGLRNKYLDEALEGTDQ